MAPVLVCLVAGARPNFVKVAALARAFQRSPVFRLRLVHTGQHYDEAMSAGFFRDLGLPSPDASLAAGSGSHAVQTARVLEGFERELLAHEPALVVVVGDVNSTMACTLAASKTLYPDGRRPRIAHVEAGLRSFDRTMPEEINRMVTDAIADDLFATERSAVENLRREGHAGERVFLVGNVMIDTLLAHVSDARAAAAWRRFDLAPRAYGVVTLHRPSNVDDPRRLLQLAGALDAASRSLPLIFPVHPRTRTRLRELGTAACGRVITCDAVPYVEFLSLLLGARAVITDSGGIQEETTMLGVPCLTLRDSTERPVTIAHGTNRLLGTDPAALVPGLETVLASPMPRIAPPPLWDGRAAARIVEILERTFVSGEALAPAAAARVI